MQLWTRLRVGYPSPSASFFPLFATKEAGLLEKYGFDTEMVYVQGVQPTTYDLFTSRYIKKIPYVNAKGVENSLSLIAESNPRAKNRKP